MNNYTADDLQEALRPLASLISKSEKAQRKIAPGTWQYAMLQENLRALHHAYALMNNDSNDTDNFTKDDLQTTLHTFASMISKVENVQAKFSPGTTQYTLQRNRLKALRVASSLITKSLDRQRRT